MMKQPTASDLLFVSTMVIACAVSYAIITRILVPFVSEPNKLLGGMWSVVATVFVFRDSRFASLKAAWQRLFATSASILLCLVYLLIFPFSGVGMALLIGVSALLMIVIGQEEDIITTAITTAVVMVVAGVDKGSAWTQPVLRFIDTLVGVAVGVAFMWSSAWIFSRAPSQATQQKR